MKQIVEFFGILILVATLAHAEPTIHQVYEAAQAGKLSEAHQMVEEVLKTHPQSAKAHYVNAEILSAQGQITQARSELTVAEQLEPGLPFAKPQAVQTLKDKLGLLGATTKSVSTEHQGTAKPFPWTTALLFGGGALVFIFLIRSALSKKPTYPTNGMNGGTPPTTSYPNAPMNPTGPQSGGGIGSGIASGLATGLAAGVGVAAGEALFNHFSNNNASTPNAGAHTAPPVDTTPQPSSSDFADNDFGISDDSSWDDSAGGDSFSDSSSDSW